MQNQADKRRIHAVLDGELTTESLSSEEQHDLARYSMALERLAKARVEAPANLRRRIMAALPSARRASLREWLTGFLPARRQWAIPALAGAFLMLVALMGIRYWQPTHRAGLVRVHFEIHAPGATRVELMGDFNHWTPGTIQLSGPDGSGHWTADIELAEGRYEYQFLVNGSTWLTDPKALARRPDQYGRENAVVDVYDERG